MVGPPFDPLCPQCQRWHPPGDACPPPRSEDDRLAEQARADAEGRRSELAFEHIRRQRRGPGPPQSP